MVFSMRVNLNPARLRTPVQSLIYLRRPESDNRRLRQFDLTMKEEHRSRVSSEPRIGYPGSLQTLSQLKKVSRELAHDSVLAKTEANKAVLRKAAKYSV